MKNLKELREAQKITQRKLAEEVGISQSNICEYEKGTIEATESIIIKLAKYFDVSTDYLLGLENYDGTNIISQTKQIINDNPNFNVTTHTNNGVVHIQYKSNK